MAEIINSIVCFLLMITIFYSWYLEKKSKQYNIEHLNIINERIDILSEMCDKFENFINYEYSKNS